MGKSKAPKAPDPLPAAQATAQANKDVAQYTTALDRPTQIDPYGQTTWEYKPGGATAVLTPAQQAAQKQYAFLQQHFADVKAGKSSDPNARAWLLSPEGQAHERSKLAAAQSAMGGLAIGSKDTPLPGEWVQRTTLSPEQQRLYNLDVQAQEKAYGLGIGAINAARAGGAGGALNLSGLPQMNALSQPNLFLAGTPTYDKTGVALPSLGGERVALGSLGLQASQTGLPQWQNLAGNVPQWAGMQGQIPQWQASQVGLPENYYENFQNQLTGMQDVDTSAQGFATQGDQVRNALYEQMTQFSGQRYQQEEAALRNQLANQGFAIGSEGFNRELEAFRRQKDESYRAAELNSILAGGAEQSRLYADMLAGTQSNIGRRATESQIDLSALAGRQGAAADIYGLGLQERGAAFEAGMAGRGQQFAESQYGFDASMLNRQQQLYEKQAGFEAGAQRYGLDLQNRQAVQQAQSDAYQADMMNRGMQFDAGLQRYGMDEATRLQNYQADMQRLNSITGRQQQGFQNQAQAEQWDAMMRERMLQERMLQRQVPLNEALAMAGMTGVTNPSYQPFNMSQPWQGVDYMAAQNQAYQGQVNQANFQNAQRGQTYGLVGSLAMAGASAW